MSKVNGLPHLEPLVETHDVAREQTMIQQAVALFNEGKLQEALMIVQQVIKENERCSKGYYIMAEVLAHLMQHEKAIKINDFALRFEPGNFDFQFQRCKILFVLRRWDEAHDSLKKAQRMRPDSYIVPMLMGDVLAQQGKLEEALKQFDAALAISDSVDVYEHKGLCLFQVRRLEESEYCFERVLKARPEYALGYVHMGKLRVAQERPEEAEQLMRKAAELNPNSQEALTYLAAFHFQRNEYDAAAAFVQAAVINQPGDLTARLLYSKILLTAGQMEPAEKQLREVLAIDSSNMPALIMLAQILVPLKRHDEALAIVDQILARDPSNTSMQFLKQAIRGETIKAAPEDYVARVFDGYANQFDYHLQQLLQYHTPDALAKAVQPLLPAGGSYSLLDLGCGTGLGAQAFAAFTGERVGVDLSPLMVDKAREKNIYADLYVDELVRHMRSDKRRYDITLAADVFVYIGDLDETFSAAAEVTKPQGLFVFSVENGDDAPPFVLRPTGRFAHSRSTIESLAAAHGFTIRVMDQTILRKEGKGQIEGYICVLQKA